MSKKVWASLARERIAELRAEGMGYVSIGEACDMSPATVMRIAQGRQRRIYEVTERRLMRVTSDARKDGVLVPKGPTLERLRELKEEGFSYRQLARAMGRKQLEFVSDRVTRVTARTESRVERLYHRAMRDASFLKEAA